MRRGMLIALYGVGGLLAAALLAWATFTVAGRQLSTPAEPIQPVTVATPARSASPTVGPKTSSGPSVRPHGPSPTSPTPPAAHTGPTTAATPAATTQSLVPVASSNGPRPSADPSSNDDHGHGHGDD